MENFFIKKIFLIIVVLAATNELFSAGCNLMIARRGDADQVFIDFFYNPQGRNNHFSHFSSATISLSEKPLFDSGHIGISKIIWIEKLKKPHRSGNIYLKYSQQFLPAIPYDEGMRDWEFSGDGCIKISASAEPTRRIGRICGKFEGFLPDIPSHFFRR